MAGRCLVAAVVLALVAGPAFASDAGDAIVGSWLTEPDEEDGRARVEIVRAGDRYEGTIVWLEKPVYPPDDDGGMAGRAKVDRENPDPALRSRPVVGLEILSDLTWDPDRREWRKGSIYAPDDGKTYRCFIRMSEDGSLRIRGYVGFALLGRTTEWTPAPAEDPVQE